MNIQTASFQRIAARVATTLAPVAAAAAMAALLGAGAPAAAPRLVQQTDDGVEITAVDYRDLDLSRPAGAATLLARLRAASDLVCRAGAPASSMTLSAVQTYKSCTHAAMDRAVRAIDWPTVTALYGGDPAIPATQLR